MYKPIIKYYKFYYCLGVTKNIQNYYMAGFNDIDYEPRLTNIITDISQERDEFVSLIRSLNELIENIKEEKEPLELNDVYNKVHQLERHSVSKIERFETIKKIAYSISELCTYKIHLKQITDGPNPHENVVKHIQHIVELKKRLLEDVIENNERKRGAPYGTLMAIGNTVIANNISMYEQLGLPLEYFQYIIQKCDEIKQISAETLNILENIFPETLRELMRVSNNKNLSFGLEGICKTYLRKNNLDLSQVPQECLDVINAPFTEKRGGRRKSRKNRKSRKSRKSRKH